MGEIRARLCTGVIETRALRTLNDLRPAAFRTIHPDARRLKARILSDSRSNSPCGPRSATTIHPMNPIQHIDSRLSYTAPYLDEDPDIDLIQPEPEEADLEIRDPNTESPEVPATSRAIALRRQRSLSH
jgi:hypothetical protein